MVRNPLIFLYPDSDPHQQENRTVYRGDSITDSVLLDLGIHTFLLSGDNTKLNLEKDVTVDLKLSRFRSVNTAAETLTAVARGPSVASETFHASNRL